MASRGEPPEDTRSHNKQKSKMPSSSREIKYVYQLPYAVLRELCRVIDCNDRWEELGGTYLGFDIATLYGLRRPAFHGVSGSSPAEVMLSRWGQKDGSLDRLFVYLAHMEFAWAMRIIHPYVSDRVRHLQRDRGCTSLLDGFSEGYQPQQSVNHRSNSSCFQAVPSNSKPSQPYYDDTEVGVNSKLKACDTGRRNAPSAYPSNCNQSSQCSNYNPALQQKVPVEATYSPPSSNLSSTISPQVPSVNTNNLDRFEKETALLPKVAAFQQSSRESSEKIINAVEEPRRDFQIHHQARQNSQAPSRKMSNDSPNANEEENSLPNRRPSDTPSLTYSSLPSVPYKEILAATQDFSTKVLGRGGFGTVFNGNWKNTDVAIKLIRKKDNPGVTALEEAKFKQSMVELRISDCCRHDNILPLYSYSLNEEGLCLVYQLMVNGSLEDRLNCKDNSKPLTWLQRCRILRGAACGIQFLHASEPPLIHGDIKSANILLDRSFEAKLGDFGLVREGPPDAATHMYVEYIHGTRAYLPPEYMRNRQLSTKVDTYSFGIVLFEVASGQKAFDAKRPKTRRSLYDYVHEVNPQKLEQVLKDRKADEECSGLFHTFIAIGMDCTKDRRHRPEMVGVFHTLGNHLNIQEIRCKAGKESAAEYLNMKDISPLERQILHDKLKHHEGRPSKEVESSNKGVETREVALNYPLPPIIKGDPNRHATEQTIPSSHCPNSYEAEPTYPICSPAYRITNIAPTCNLNSCPPSYEEAMNKVQGFIQPQEIQPKIPLYEMPPQTQQSPPQSLQRPPQNLQRLPQNLQRLPQTPQIPPQTPQNSQTQSDMYGSGEDVNIPLLTELGVKGIKVPLGNPQGNNGDVQYVSYVTPPMHFGAATADTYNVAVGAGGGAKQTDIPGSYYEQELSGADNHVNFDAATAAALESLSLIENGASSA